MLHSYLPILIFLLVSAFVGLAAVVSGKLLGKLLHKNAPNAAKLEAYECGFPAFTDARSRFDVKFYLVAILFIVFDLEVAFLFPFAVAMRGLHHGALLGVGIFLLLLIVGFIYEWKKGALEWE
jgi:NADH-quinone oxidoreductase subunit A